MGHFEDPGLPGYTPEGAAAAGSSVLSYGGEADGRGPYTWEEAVYHRTGLLDPRLASSGFWAEHGIGCMGVFGEAARTEPALTIHPYPHDGQRGVATTFACNETPNPCLGVPGNDGATPVGFIPSVQFNGPWSSIVGPAVSAASLTPDGEAPIPLTVEDMASSRAANLDDGLALIPHAPLREGRWYTGRVEGVLHARQDGDFGEVEVAEPFSLTWRFQTVIVPRDPELRLELAGGRAILSTLSPAPATLSLHGGAGKAPRILPAPLGRLADGRYGVSVPFAPPNGAWRLCASQAARPADGWTAARTCTAPRALRLRVRAVFADGRRLRLRIEAPAPARGQRASIVVRAGGRTRARRVVRLRRSATVSIRGRRLTPARLRVSAPSFVRGGRPYRVVPVTLGLRDRSGGSRRGRD